MNITTPQPRAHTDITQTTIIAVSFNSPDLINTLLGSVRRFYSNKVYIIADSEPDIVSDIQPVTQKYPNVELTIKQELP